MSENKELAAGLVGHAETFVDEENTAESMKSGMLPVFATPAMVALMEEAACAAIAEALRAGETSVGISLSIAHLAATPVGRKVQAEAKLLAVEGRKLTYEIVARDASGEIGKGTHERFLVDVKKFLQKAASR
ncbi:thioesterase family protein [Selenomonas sp. TAMA-11512]|uniref:thioesterase family protein n=1 Tax=Selenomonas sp. TAMA-11512 TaxID=3095337 RepID=UPI003089E91C|nr:thioesterase family protein [Selenomonas sp. TAMA-11512]